MLRGHAAWALGQIGNEAARTELKKAADKETDSWVLEEIQSALNLSY